MWTRLGVILLIVYHSSCATLKPDDETWNWANNVYQNSQTTTEAPNEDEELDLSPTDIDKSESCLLPDGSAGKCVPYYLCDSDTKHIIEDGTTILDLRAGACYSYFDVCCKLGSIEPSQDTVTNAPENARTTQDDKMFTKPSSDEETCGWENSKIFAFRKVDNQIYANFGQFRWMVAIIKKGKKEAWNQDDYIGGGSIIHPSVVITAAHKVDEMQPHELKCRGGEWDTQTTKEQYPYQERDVKNKIIHPNFFVTSLYYDVALLFLKDPFDVQVPHMGTACLSSVLPPPSTECYSMGWGKSFNKSEQYAVVLKKVKLPLVSSEVCQSSLQKTRLGPFFRLHSSLTCAGGKQNVDTCTKDGGSSLVCPIENDGNNMRYAVVGMVAYGIGVCGTENVPAVYVNVPEIYSWVNEIMAREMYGNATYFTKIKSFI